MLKGILEKMLGENIDITGDEMMHIRHLNDFDLKMLLSEIHDHGWPVAQRTLRMMVEAARKRDAH